MDLCLNQGIVRPIDTLITLVSMIQETTEYPLQELTQNKSRRKGRLTAENWISAAEDMLERRGIDAVRIEPLAKKLKVTKGSFYYHFKDRPTLLTTLLDNWRRRATNAVISRLESRVASPEERLRGLLELHRHGSVATEGASLELAIRQWAKADKIAQRAVEEVDSHRHRYIAGIYHELGLDTASAEARAFLLYSTLMGLAYLEGIASDSLMEHCEHILLEQTPFVEART